jgi:uncharacterized protein DUF1259
MKNALLCVLLALVTALGQGIPSDYAHVMTALGKQGDFKDGVLKINIPRNDIKVSIDGIPTPTPFGFGGWLAMTRGTAGQDVMMGDLVLLEGEVNPVMSALLDHGLDVTALHNHFFFENPRVFYVHVHGHGKAEDLARMVKPAVDLIGHLPPRHPGTDPTAAVISGSSAAGLAGPLNVAALVRIAGHEGEQNGPVYKITVGRDDLKLYEMGAPINSRMGLNSWAAFYGRDALAEVAGDIAMLPTEVTPVLKALRANELDVVAVHNHMTTATQPIYFLHYWGTGPAEKLARGFRAALDQLHPPAGHSVSLH